MTRIIDSRAGLDQTVKIFDDFYSMNLVVNGNEFDIVYGYFKSVCSTKTIAQNFTAFLFKISQETNIPAVTLINNIQGVSKMEMNKTIAYYMNSFKSKTSLYGVSIVPSPNQSVARNIVQ
jgi:hypothetical protein